MAIDHSSRESSKTRTPKMGQWTEVISAHVLNRKLAIGDIVSLWAQCLPRCRVNTKWGQTRVSLERKTCRSKLMGFKLSLESELSASIYNQLIRIKILIYRKQKEWDKMFRASSKLIRKLRVKVSLKFLLSRLVLTSWIKMAIKVLDLPINKQI